MHYVYTLYRQSVRVVGSILSFRFYRQENSLPISINSFYTIAGGKQITIISKNVCNYRGKIGTVGPMHWCRLQEAVDQQPVCVNE